MEQGQDLDRAAADIFVRLRGRLAVWSPTAARVRHGLERAGLVFGWVFAAHQLGAAVAAYGAGLTRTLLLTYNPALFTAGAACLVAAAAILAIRRPKRAAVPVAA